MSVFPLNIENKEDHPDKIAKLVGIATKYYETAAEINKKRQALEELKAIIDAYTDGNGKTFLTIVSAMAVDPLPGNNIPFKVVGLTPSADDGYYIYMSTEVSGYVKLPLEILKKASGIEENNPDLAVSGDVFDAIAAEQLDRAAAIAAETAARELLAESVTLNTEKTDNILNKDDEFIITDTLGRIGFKVDNNGANVKAYNICDANGLIVGTIDKALYDQIIAKTEEGSLENIIDHINFTNQFLLIDALGKIGLRYDETNGFDVGKLSDHFKSLIGNASGGTVQIESTFTGDFVVHLVYGQSLAVGGSASNEDFYTTKTFTNGVYITQSYANTTEANNETTQQARFLGISDAPSSSSSSNSLFLSKKVNELIVDDNNKNLEQFNHSQFAITTGASGAQWFQLTKWNEARTTQWVNVIADAMPTALAFGGVGEGRAYLNLMQSIYFANKFAKAQGKKLTVATLSYIQGEASGEKNNTVTQFKAKLNALFDDIKLDVATITGQTTDIKFITYQNHSFALYNDPTRPEWTGTEQYTEGVPLAMVDITNDRNDTFFGTTLYPYGNTPAPTGDLIHLPTIGYAMMSSMLGIQAKRVVNDNNPHLPIYPKTAEISIWQSGSTWYTYVPFDVVKKPLVFDVSDENMRGHGLQTNYGFEIIHALEGSIITNVTLSSDNAVIIETTEDPTGSDLTYAITGAMGGGNLRDSQGDTITATIAGITYRCDNWCPFFRITL